MQRYGTFEERGYAFESWIPSTDSDPVGFEIRILIGAAVKYTLLVPMLYVPVMGVDIDDDAHMEAVLERVLKLLPPADQFSADTVAALDALDQELGGSALRARHAARPADSERGAGQFEYVHGLFAQQYADLVGGPEAMAKWMATPLRELDGRTPAEALRIGLAREVIAVLMAMPKPGDPSER